MKKKEKKLEKLGRLFLCYNIEDLFSKKSWMCQKGIVGYDLKFVKRGFRV